jgi:predicted MFS family arabinose efflux permease
LLWFASGPAIAALGAAPTGFGYSLFYPGLGIEAMRRAPPQSRGLAMGTYTVFLDVALGFGSPLLGLIAGRAGLGTAFLVTAIIVACAAIVAVLLLVSPASEGIRRENLCRCARFEFVSCVVGLCGRH